MSQHTPTPWHVTAKGHVAYKGNEYLLSGLICEMTDPGHPSSLADAEFIVRACNSFFALLAALEIAGELAERCVRNGLDFDKETTDGIVENHWALTQIRAALTLARTPAR